MALSNWAFATTFVATIVGCLLVLLIVWYRRPKQARNDMATLGSLHLDFEGKLNSGLAQLLLKPPKAKNEFTYQGACLRVAPDTPFVICSFSGATSHEDVIKNGPEMLQNGLDILSMTGGADLATRDAANEYLAWWKAKDETIVSIVSTATFSFSVGPITLEVRDAAGNLVPPTPVIPLHHLGFRYYRLSQVSDDLFDAFRNMYLAFELLLSTKYPKGREREIDWLRASLIAAADDLNLPALAAGPNPIDYIISVVYNNARLPLFHAKDGRTYFVPVTSGQDRKAVSAALQLLTPIVIRMADVWHQTRRGGGGVNLKLVEEGNKNLFANASFIVSSEPAADIKDDLFPPAFGTPFEAKLINNFDGQPHPHLHGRLSLSSMEGLECLRHIYVINHKKKLLLSHELEAPLTLHGFNILEPLFFLRATNATEPRTLFPM